MSFNVLPADLDCTQRSSGRILETIAGYKAADLRALMIGGGSPFRDCLSLVVAVVVWASSIIPLRNTYEPP